MEWCQSYMSYMGCERFDYEDEDEDEDERTKKKDEEEEAEKEDRGYGYRVDWRSARDAWVTTGRTMSYWCSSNLRTSWTPLSLFVTQKSMAAVELRKSIASAVERVQDSMSLK